MAVYLAEDINATTLQPLYGARIPGVIADNGAGAEGQLSTLQRKRRVWTHAACDPDGDGWIHDCDISAGWKYRWLMKGQGPMLQPQPNPISDSNSNPDPGPGPGPGPRPGPCPGP